MKWDQMWEAVKDPRIYLFFFGVLTANIANGGVSNFGSEIIKQVCINPALRTEVCSR